VADLVTQAGEVHGGVGQIPFVSLADDMLNCKLERRGRRRGR